MTNILTTNTSWYVLPSVTNSETINILYEETVKDPRELYKATDTTFCNISVSLCYGN